MGEISGIPIPVHPPQKEASKIRFFHFRISMAFLYWLLAWSGWPSGCKSQIHTQVYIYTYYVLYIYEHIKQIFKGCRGEGLFIVDEIVKITNK